MGIKIFVDVGHGGSDSGATAGAFIEKEMNLTTAVALKSALLRNGFEVMLSREADLFVSINDSADMANRWDADLVVSIHYNAGGGDRAEVIYSVFPDEGRELAPLILSELVKLGQSSAKSYSKYNSSGTADYFGIIRETLAPAVIIESCFLDNEEDITLADTHEKQQAVGEAIAKAVCLFFNIKWIGVSEKMAAIVFVGEGKEMKLLVDEKEVDGSMLVEVRGNVIATSAAALLRSCGHTVDWRPN